MKLTLDMAERLCLLQLLPPKGSRRELQTAQDFRELLLPDDEERKRMRWVDLPDGRMTCLPGGEPLKMVEAELRISARFNEMLKQMLVRADSERVLPVELAPLYDNLVGEIEPAKDESEGETAPVPQNRLPEAVPAASDNGQLP